MNFGVAIAVALAALTFYQPVPFYELKMKLLLRSALKSVFHMHKYQEQTTPFFFCNQEGVPAARHSIHILYH